MFKKLIALLLLASPAFSQVNTYECPRGNRVSGTLTSDVTDTSTNTVISAPGGSTQRLYVVAGCVTNSHASQGTVVTISCGSAAAAKQRLYAGPGGGWCVPPGGFIRCDAATALTLTPTTSGASVQAWFGACKDTN